MYTIDHYAISLLYGFRERGDKLKVDWKRNERIKEKVEKKMV